MAVQKTKKNDPAIRISDAFQCRVKSQLLDNEIVYTSHGSIRKTSTIAFVKINIKELLPVMAFNNSYHNLFPLLAEIH
jgi:hypothetical protein